MASVQLTVNGQARQLELDPRQSLLDVLREALDLTGTKKGCNQGACGACTVLVNGKRIVSCLTLAAMHDGAEIENLDIPHLEAHFVEEEDPHVNPLGVKGLGEIALVGMAPAIANAIFHATGKRVRTLPIRIEDVLTA